MSTVDGTQKGIHSSLTWSTNAGTDRSVGDSEQLCHGKAHSSMGETVHENLVTTELTVQLAGSSTKEFPLPQQLSTASV